MSRKKTEHTILAIFGIGLIVTTLLLLLKKADREFEHDDLEHFITYGEQARGLHVFSETGILL